MMDRMIVVEALREAASALESVTTSEAKAARALRSAIDAATAQLSVVLAAMDEARLHEAEGASSIATWARRELGQDARTTRQMVRNARTLRDLPAVGEAAASGQVSFEHVNAFTFALRHVGHDVVQTLELPLRDLAVLTTPRELFAKIRQIRAVERPDELDQAWLRGMEKRDISLSPLPGGWHLTGFLDVETGGKLDAVLKNLSVPRDADDTRTAAERRMDGFDGLLSAVLEHGLPSDHGVRPHLFVTVQAETLQDMYRTGGAGGVSGDGPDGALEPVVLEGFGPIGRGFTRSLLCDAQATPLLVRSVEGNPEVLDVGRDERFATPRQAKAIRHRQGGVCASPGCQHPIGHHHHVQWWSHGGHTTLDTMVGLCRKCHTLVHADRLTVTGTYATGFTITKTVPEPTARTG